MNVNEIEKQAWCYEDNAGGIVVTDGADFWDVSGVISDGCGEKDLIACCNGDTEGWTVPKFFGIFQDHGKLVAHYDGQKITLYPEDMGTAAREYFGVENKE